jgi:hypothetical protein
MIHSSADKQYSGDSYFREQGFYSNTFTPHFPVDPNACLCYPSQFYSDLPQVSLTMRRFLSWWGGCSCAPEDPHCHLQCRSSFTVHQPHPVVVGRRSTFTSSCYLYVRVSRRTLTVRFPTVGKASEVFGFRPEFIYPVVTLPPLLLAPPP